jgi:metallo-beta-lactamase family protein
MQIQFFGAVRNTVGSMHLLSFDSKNVLLDCGLFQGRRAESREKNLNLPFIPKDIDALVLSHAHIDHSGNIPNLVKQDFSGPVFCTFATQDLCRAMLLDSAHIQEKDAEYVNKKHKRRGEAPVEPLYTIDDAEESLAYFLGQRYNREFKVLKDLNCKFLDAGHILGSAIPVLDVLENGQQKRIVFSGDLGRKNLPILRDPQIPEDANYLIIESTYGNRLHEPIEKVEGMLRDVVLEVYKRKGKIIIPAFSVGRTQEIVYSLHRLRVKEEIPHIKVFVDSPLSTNVTEIFRIHPECYDREVRDLLLVADDPFGFEGLTYIRSVESSKALNHCQEPCIIISASGMCEAGRILHHLKNNIEDPKNVILIVGFMAQNTLGRKLAEHQHEVKIFGEPYNVQAQVVVMDEFSAHADRNELIEFVGKVNDNGNLKNVFVVHGEEEQSMALADNIKSQLNIPVNVPAPGDSYYL